jgi:hypothetical protein
MFTMRRSYRIAAALAGSIPALGFAAGMLDDLHARQSQTRWYKGNTHTHTINSDGDSSPDEVARWYKEHGYQFVVLTDHNYLTSVDGLNALMGADEKFLIVRGEEVTSRFETKPIHINGLGVQRLVAAQQGASVLETVQRNVDAIRAANGVPHINHPNFGWAISANELAQVRNTRLFEIFNGHPIVNNEGGGGVLGLEAAWDTILSRGVLLYGLAVDDAHHFKRPEDREASRPGQGWIYVRAPRLDPAGLLAAMERGDFYASTGVELSDYVVTRENITITVREKPWAKYRVRFYGKGGRLLKEATASPAHYDIKGDEGYVRAKILESSGFVAWTQPVVIGR